MPPRARHNSTFAGKMNAMIFAAGLGSRLAPLTDDCPKALLPVAGIPMIEHAVKRLRDTAGVDRIVVNVHSHADMLERWIGENAGRLGVEIVVSDERACLLDTGGGLLAARHMLAGSDRVLLYNADIITDIDLGEMLEAHDASGADVTLLTADRTTVRKLLFDAGGRMRGWINEKTGETRPAGISDVQSLERLAFGGVHIVGQRVFELLHEYAGEVGGSVFSITPFYIAMCSRLNIKSWRQPESCRWIDAGKPESYAEANRLWC